MAIRALERLNPRERRLVNALGVILACGMVLAIPFGLESMVHAREAENQELYAALTSVGEARALVHERQGRGTSWRSATPRRPRRSPASSSRRRSSRSSR